MPINDTSIVLVKSEGSSYGTYANPTGAADAFVVFDYQPTVLESEQVRRQIERGFPGQYPTKRTAKRARHPFSIELAGSGTADVAAKWGQLLLGALFGAPTLQAGVSATYPLSSSGDGGSVSICGFKGDVARMRGKGSRGALTMSFQERQLPFLRLEYQSLIEGSLPVDSAAPGAITLPTYPAPVEVNLDNTAVQLGGYTLGCKSVEISFGQKVEYYSTTGGRAIIFGKDDSGDRRSITAKVRFEMPDPAVKNFFADLDSDTAVAFSLVHGTTAGNIIDISSANCFVANLTITVEQGKLFLDADLNFVPSAANNELVIKTR